MSKAYREIKLLKTKELEDQVEQKERDGASKKKKELIMEFLVEFKNEYGYVVGLSREINEEDVPFETIDLLTEGLVNTDGLFDENEYQEALVLVKDAIFEIFREIALEMPTRINKRKNKFELDSLLNVRAELKLLENELLEKKKQNPFLSIYLSDKNFYGKNDFFKKVEGYVERIDENLKLRNEFDAKDFGDKSSLADFKYLSITGARAYVDIVESYRKRISELELICLRKKEVIERVFKEGGSIMHYTLIENTVAGGFDLDILFYRQDGSREDKFKQFSHKNDRDEFYAELEEGIKNNIIIGIYDGMLVVGKDFIEKWKDKKPEKVYSSDSSSPWSLRREN
ncbi:MAG: hypothetical protein US25_C0068G0004 [Candidatus Moranbacteria bacterium GW2011_GWE1_36_7]|nr:MAG: hypothetical protein UR99_C0058G0004 [Candidatus Moranbacteria bacterium GW2011_GWD2_36_12]KKQ11908.1 MAG: hypothetical protein US25_C0068G0004 [Candidatus Moranbacteria bacterium GW2011_GWE1_36_7]